MKLDHFVVVDFDTVVDFDVPKQFQHCFRNCVIFADVGPAHQQLVLMQWKLALVQHPLLAVCSVAMSGNVLVSILQAHMALP